MQDTINSLGTLHGDTLTATKFQLRMRKWIIYLNSSKQPSQMRF
jgi:hypothetical protein